MTSEPLPPTSPVTVLVVEDDPALRAELAAMVGQSAGLQLLGVAGSLHEALAVLQRAGGPDVMLVDLGLPDGDGSTLIAALRERYPQAQALVTTVFGDEAHVLRALEAGAQGYLLKDSTRDELARAIRQVHEGGTPLSPSVARYLLKRFAPAAGSRAAAPAPGRARHAPVPPAERLSPREVEVLTLLSHGHTAGEVAQRLQLSLHTVNTHLRNSYGKLAASNRMQAVSRARASGQIR